MGEKRPQILCVEDHPDFCDMVAVVLPEFEIVSTDTKATAVQMARDRNFALILLDYHLTDGTGEEACKQIRSFDPITPVLFITGEEYFTESKARAMGAQGCLKKATPNFIDELHARAVELSLV